MASTSKKKRPAPGRPAPKPAVSASAGETVRAGMDFYDKVVWYCLHALVVLVPIAMSNLTFLKIGGGLPLTYDQFDIAKVFVMRALTIVALAAWSWKMLMKGGKLRRTKVDWFVLAFLAWVTITTLTSISPATAFWGKYRRFEGLASFILYAVVLFLVVQVVDRPSRIRSLARSLFIGGVLVGLYGVLQALGGDIVQWGQLPFEANRSFASYGNPDLLGGYLMFPLPIAVGLWFTEEDAIWRLIYGAGFVTLVVCWITAFVRGAWIGGAVSMALLAVLAVVLIRRGEVLLHWVDAVVAGAVALVGGGMIVRSLRAPAGSVMNIQSRLASILQFGEGSAKTRFEIWQAAWDSVKARPIFGFGADTFRLVFPKYKPMAYTRDAGYLSVADNVHDYPLQLASGIGIPGLLLLYIGVFGVVLVVSMMDILRRATGPTRYLLLAIWAACLGYIVHLFFGLSVTGSTVFLWLCFGLLLSSTAWSVEVKAPAWGSIAAIVLMVAFGGMFIYNVTYMVADNHYLQARIAGQYDPNVHISQAKAAVALNPWNDMYRAEVGLAYQDLFFAYLQQSFQANGEQRTQLLSQAQSAFQQAEVSMKEAIAFVPTEYDNYVFLADLYNRGGAYLDRAYFTDAVNLAEKAIRDVEPYGPAIRLQAAQGYQGLGDSQKALELLDSASAMDPGYGDAFLLKGQILHILGRLPEAKAALTTAIDRTSNAGLKQAAQQQLAAVEASLNATAAPASK